MEGVFFVVLHSTLGSRSQFIIGYIDYCIPLISSQITIGYITALKFHIHSQVKKNDVLPTLSATNSLKIYWPMICFSFFSCAAGHATFLEHLVLCIVIGVPILGTAFIGYGSISILYSYVLLFDMLRCLGHSNVEVIPHHLFENIPLLKYLVYTPT